MKFSSLLTRAGLAALAIVSTVLLALAANDLTLSTGTTFITGPRLTPGEDLNTVLSAVNTLRDQADGTATSTPTFTTATVNTAIVPDADGGANLGSATLSWDNLFLDTGAVVNWDNGDVTLTHAANSLAFSGATSGYSFVGPVLPATDGGSDLGAGTQAWDDLFLDTGATINFDNGDVVLTHSANALAFTGATSGYSFTGPMTITEASSAALQVGPNGVTNPGLQVDTGAATSATGLKITTAAAAGGLAVAVISSGADEALTINAKGTGTIGIGSVSTGAVTITPATTVTGALTPTGGVAAAGGFSSSCRNFATGGLVPAVSTDFTDSTPVNTEAYVGEVFVPANCTATGIAVFNGSNVTDNIKVGLYDSAGNRVAQSASTAGSGADSYQLVPFTGSYAVKGPATYYIVGTYAAGTSRYNAPPLGAFGCGKLTGLVFDTLPATMTPPTTFTANLCNIASLY